jgi:hypothetical protein
LRHSVLLVFGAPCQLRSLAGQEHGRTIPLAEVARHAAARLYLSIYIVHGVAVGDYRPRFTSMTCLGFGCPSLGAVL